MKLNSLHLFSLALATVFVAGVAAFAQGYPDEIRGYKVHDAKIVVTNRDDKASRETDSDADAFARIGDPRLVETGVTGLTFELDAAIDPVPYKGRVDFLTFNDFRVNGLAVTIEEFAGPFEFKKDKPISLPRPIRVFLPSTQALRGAIGELRGSKEEWNVTGTVFVFGRFKKWGFGVKRVVPVRIDVRVKNPVHDRPLLQFPG